MLETWKLFIAVLGEYRNGTIQVFQTDFQIVTSAKVASIDV